MITSPQVVVERHQVSDEPLKIYAPGLQYGHPFIDVALFVHGKKWDELFESNPRTYEDGKFYSRTSGPGLDFVANEWAVFGWHDRADRLLGQNPVKGWWHDGRCGTPRLIAMLASDGWCLTYEEALGLLRLRMYERLGKIKQEAQAKIAEAEEVNHAANQLPEQES